MSTLALKINGVSVTNINSDFNEEIVRRKDLDIGTIRVINDSNDEAFDVDSEVEVIIDGISRYFILQQDIFERVTQSPIEYDHTLEIIEVTKKLEGISIPIRRFVQPQDGELGDADVYTVWDQLERIRTTANLLTNSQYLAGTNFPFEYSTDLIDGIGLSLEDYTDQIKGKTLTINTSNVREALDLILQQAGLEVTMTGFNTVGATWINYRGNQITVAGAIVHKGQQLLNQYADKVDYFLENAISESNVNKQAVKYPSVAWASVRASDSFLTSDEFIMEVAEPIDRVLKFEVYFKAEFDILGTDTVYEIEADVTELLTNKTLYNTLLYNLVQTAGGYGNTVCRNNSVYFERGGTRIEGWHEQLDVFTGITGVYYSYRHFLCYAFFKQEGFISADADFTGGTNFEDFMFRLTYVPLEKERLRLERKNPLGSRTLQINQQERVPDIEKLGRKGIEDLERLGNKELIISKTVDDYANVYQIGDYYNDYVVDGVKNYVDRGEIITVAMMSKGSQNISLDVGVNTEQRDTPVDAENAVIRQEIYNEYVEVSYVGSTDNDSMVTTAGLKRYSETFNVQTSLTGNAVELCEFDGYRTLMIQCTSKGTANVIKFDIGFDSPNIAGRSTEEQDGIFVSTYQEYADGEGNEGRLTTFTFQFLGSFEPDTATFAEYATLAQMLPLLYANASKGDIYIDSTDMVVLKDGGEILRFTYQLSHFDVTGDIIVGDKLSTNNALVIAEVQRLYLLKSQTDFKDRQIVLPSEYDEKLIIINIGTPIEGEIKVQFSNTANYATVFVDDSSSYNWAIVDENNELFLAVNSKTKKRVYFNPKNQRS